MGDALTDVGKVVYDTGSAWLTLKGDECTGCDANVYDTTTSSSFAKITNSDTVLTYGSASVTGYKATDDVCIANSAPTCVLDYEWVVGVEVTGLDGRDGILGMSTGLYTGVSSPETLLIQALADDGIITDPVFGFSLFGTETQSFVDIGVLQASSMKNPTDMVWLDVAYEDVFFWAQVTTGVRFD